MPAAHTTNDAPLRVEGLPALVQIIDAKGRIERVSDRWLEWLGYERSEVVGRNFRDLVPTQNSARVAGLMDTLAREGTLRDAPLQLRHTDGTLADVLLSATADLDPEGDLAGAQVVLVDVTEKVLVFQELERLQRDESLAELAAGVAHDINNALFTIFGNTELLASRGLPKPLEQHVDAIRTAAEQAQETMRSLLHFSDAPTDERAVQDLAEVTRRVLDICRKSFSASIRIETHLPDPRFPRRHVHVMAALGRLQRVILNLCMNASDAMPEGGALSIRVEQLDAERCVLEVSDTGRGMSPEVLQRACEPFFSTKSSAKNAGLGLAIVRRIVEELEGEISFESEPGVGTTVRIVLDRCAAPALESKPDPTPGLATRRLSRVLVVDDDTDVRDVLRRHFERKGAEVDEAGTIEELLGRFANDMPNLELIVLDMDLPDGRGDEALADLRFQDIDLPVLLISGRVPAIDIEQFGAAAFLAKPFASASLWTAVDTVLARHGTLRASSASAVRRAEAS